MYRTSFTYCSFVRKTRFLCVSMTPLGKPVVPLEYSIIAVFSGSFLTLLKVFADSIRSENFMQSEASDELSSSKMITLLLAAGTTCSTLSQVSGEQKTTAGFVMLKTGWNSSEKFIFYNYDRKYILVKYFPREVVREAIKRCITGVYMLQVPLTDRIIGIVSGKRSSRQQCAQNHYRKFQSVFGDDSDDCFFTATKSL